MIITTSRKPSPKIRTFCKNLSRFTGCKYVPRGKTGLEAFPDDNFLLVGEYKGNPGSFNFFLKGISILSIHASVSMDKEIGPGQAPVIEGESKLAQALRKATGFKDGKTSERVIQVDDNIEFIAKEIPYIVLKVLSVRGEGLVRSV